MIKATKGKWVNLGEMQQVVRKRNPLINVLHKSKGKSNNEKRAIYASHLKAQRNDFYWVKAAMKLSYCDPQFIQGG